MLQKSLANLPGLLLPVRAWRWLLLSFCGMLLVVLSTASAQEAKTPVEHFVIEHLKVNGDADFSESDFKNPTLRHEFVEELIRSPNLGPGVAKNGVSISHATIAGRVLVNKAAIPFGLQFYDCRFKDGIDLSNDHFAGNLLISKSEFGSPEKRDNGNDVAVLSGSRVDGTVEIDAESEFFGNADFEELEVVGDFRSQDVQYSGYANFMGMKNRSTVDILRSTFEDGLDLSDSNLVSLTGC